MAKSYGSGSATLLIIDNWPALQLAHLPGTTNWGTLHLTELLHTLSPNF